MENSNQSNPLMSHFRQPAIYLKLPSEGRYWDNDAVNLPVNGEVPVYPMTTKDEIMLRTPDALLNGAGVVSVIQSCIPAIQDAWKMPSIDVDSCLIAIRIATYGNDMDVTTTCPNCKHENDHTIDLGQTMSQINIPVYDVFAIGEGLEAKLKPQNYFEINRTNMIGYEEQRMMAVLDKQDLTPEDKESAIREITSKLVDLNVLNLASSTDYIKTSDGTYVNNFDHIKEFYSNTSSKIIRKVQDQLVKLAEQSGLPPYPTKCVECTTEYSTEVTFDYASFFVNGS